MIPEQSNSITLSAEQMEALSNPLRSRIVLALRTGGAGSVRDLSLRLLVDPKILYYPLKRLLKSGLVVQTGSHKTSNRTEAEYDLVAHRMELPEAADLGLRQRLMRTTLRCAEQEALKAQAASVTDPALNDAINIMRVPLWLSPDDRTELFRRFKELVSDFAGRSKIGENELLLWTSLIVPVPRNRTERVG